MSTRLNQERKEKLEPIRMAVALEKLRATGIHIDNDETAIWFIFKGSKVIYWPYSGWASGKSIKDGRGLKNLLKQIDEELK